MSLRKKRRAAGSSRLFRGRMSSTLPSWSTARHRYFHSPLILTKTSSRCFPMLVSSRSGDGRCDLVAPSVTDESPQDVDAAACKRDDGLGVPFAFRSLAV